MPLKTTHGPEFMRGRPRPASLPFAPCLVTAGAGTSSRLPGRSSWVVVLRCRKSSQAAQILRRPWRRFPIGSVFARARAPGSFQHPAGWKPALQQTGNLRCRPRPRVHQIPTALSRRKGETSASAYSNRMSWVFTASRRPRLPGPAPTQSRGADEHGCSAQVGSGEGRSEGEPYGLSSRLRLDGGATPPCAVIPSRDPRHNGNQSSRSGRGRAT